MNKIVIVLAFFLFAAAYQAVRTDGTTLTGGGLDDDPLGVDTSYIATQYDISGFGASKPDPLNVASALGSAILAESFSREATYSGVNLVDSRIYIAPLWLAEDATITGVKWVQNTQGNYTGDQYNGLGLYSYSGGTITLVASSTDDADIWKGASGSLQSKAFSSTYAASAGLYYVAAIYNNSAQTTAPQIGYCGTLSTAWQTFDFTNSAKWTGAILTQLTLPASTTMASVSAQQYKFYFALY